LPDCRDYLFGARHANIHLRFDTEYTYRSTVATATFFVTGVITAGALYRGSLPSVGPIDWTLGQYGKTLLALQVIPLTISGLLFILVSPLFFYPSSVSHSQVGAF
jgi:hypothetical protein